MHFHFNLYVPNRKGGVNFVLQNELPVWQDKESRMEKFAARYEAGEVPEWAWIAENLDQKGRHTGCPFSNVFILLCNFLFPITDPKTGI